MKSTMSLVARQCLLQQWASQIRECNQRPEGMSVSEWCSQHGITKTNYYYRLRQVRKACLDSIPQDKLPAAAVNDGQQAVLTIVRLRLSDNSLSWMPLCLQLESQIVTVHHKEWFRTEKICAGNL